MLVCVVLVLGVGCLLLVIGMVDELVEFSLVCVLFI